MFSALYRMATIWLNSIAGTTWARRNRPSRRPTRLESTSILAAASGGAPRPGEAVRDLAEARAKRQGPSGPPNTAPAGGTATPAVRKPPNGPGGRPTLNSVAPPTWSPRSPASTKRLRRHQASLDHTASRLKRREANTQAVIHDGLEQQQQASRLAERITAERDHLDGALSASDIRRSALRREQLRSLGRAPRHEPPEWQAPGIEM